MQINIYSFNRKTKDGRNFTTYSLRTKENKFIELRFLKSVNTFDIKEPNMKYTVEVAGVYEGKNPKGFKCYWIKDQYTLLKYEKHEFVGNQIITTSDCFD